MKTNHSLPDRTVWIPADAPAVVRIIDQRQLPWAFVTEDLRRVEDVAAAIRDMHVRGAGCIGATAAYGMWLATETSHPLDAAAALLKSTRPTAANLAWAVDRMLLEGATRAAAEAIAEEDVAACRAIGRHGLELFDQQRRALCRPDHAPLHILTHCNAGWLAFVAIGTATAPIYAAHDAGRPVHVWVDETRPRNQGARLTAWELARHGVPHTVIADNAGGHLMQQGRVDIVITGADRIARNGDAANKIGTYLKALAAADCGIPFYVAFPSSTIDWALADGRGIPIEERHADEVGWIDGPDSASTHHSVRVCPPDSHCANPAFDVTPARLITRLITEWGACPATESDLRRLESKSQPPAALRWDATSRARRR
ncbi:MAG: S-methyl-5-thioribose-1-phosphate isomerase [Verrucomicrobiales bacterium]